MSDGANQTKGLGRKKPKMIIIVNTETGEWNELRVGHRDEAENFYHDLPAQRDESVRGDGSQRARALV